MRVIDTVAIYIRLSLADGDLCSGGKEESESITNQRRLLMAYIQDFPELCGANIVEYCDDGYTGKNFERPGFKKMMEAAQAGAIQCILVKDLSRFGRDYITVGNYISKVLPFLGVRLISVKDIFDGARKDDVDSLNVCFQTLIYDLYSRDLSQKVKSAKRQLVERGVYINPMAPFGYRRDAGDKHRLLIDPASAETVRRMFDMAAEGASTREIARWLNTQQTPTPSRQKRGTSGEHANWSANNFWTQKMVSGILRDRQYARSLIWGKRVRNQIGVHQQLTTRVEERVIVDDCHEAIVSMGLYQRAQAVLGGEYRHNRSRMAREYPLRGKIYCGICGYAIVRTAHKHAYYRCATPITLPGAKCAQEKVYEGDLVDVIITAIQTQAAYAVDAERLLAAQRERDAALVRSEQAELEQIGTQRHYLVEQMQRLYIETNPARNIITKFGKQGKTPDPYTIEQMQKFMGNIIGTEWEMPVVLAGLYGLRMSEIIGLRTANVDLEKMQFGVVEQMPFKVPPGTKTITEMAPTKSNDRLLPITEETLPYFLRQLDLIERQKDLLAANGGEYYDNKLLITLYIRGR